MKHEQFLKIPSIFIKKADEERVLNNSSCQLFFVVQYVLLLNAKVKTDPIKHQDSIITPTFFEPILILSTLFRSAVCPLVKCKSYNGSDKASRVYSR